MKVVIIGAGPAGIMASIQAAKRGLEVLLIEKNAEIGKKLNITGKGRCNITYEGNNDFFLENVVANSKFMMSSINTFNNEKLLMFLKEMGIETKKERGNRYFLSSDNAQELTQALKQEIKKMKVKLLTNTKATRIILNKKTNEIEEVELQTKQEMVNIKADAVIITTGGNSYPSTGSSGDGYNIAKKLGHNIVEIKPALVAFKIYERDICSKLEGLTLKNISLKITKEDINKKSKTLDERFGELLFTSRGITGPIILSSSSKINKEDQLDVNTKHKKILINIDLKPALTKDELYARITRDFIKYSNKEYKNSLRDLLPTSLIPIIIEKSVIDAYKKVNNITKEDKQRLVEIIKNLTFTLEGLENLSSGIVTSGGVSTKEISPKTMESKLVSGLFFAGEVIDIDAYTGGFNLQIAFTTGYVAGISVG